MQRNGARIFLFALFSIVSLSAARAENSATFTLSTPRYFVDSRIVSSSPSFILGQRGSFTSLESFSSSATYAVNASALSASHPGYYVSKWVLSTAWGAGLGGTEIATQSGGTSFAVTFDYGWAAKYGNALELTVYLSPMTYTLAYGTNGGAWTVAEPATGPWKYSAGGTVPAASDISRTGYALTGWKSSTGKTLAAGDAFTGATLGVTANEQEVTLTAQWSSTPYTATIAAGTGGSGESTVTYSYSEDQVQTKPVTLPVREGHSISGWTASGYSGTAPTISGSTLTIPAKTSGDFTMTPTWQADTCSLYLEMKPGIAKICYRLGSQTYYDETTESISVPAAYGTAWSAYAVATEGCTTNATCAASGTIGVGGAKFSPRVDTKPYSLQLKPGKGIATIYYKTNDTQSVWLSTDRAATVSVLFGDKWFAYATPKAGYAYTMTSETLPKTGTMTTEGSVFAPEATAHTIWVRYERNGGGDSGQMSDSEFTYDVEAPLRLNAFARTCTISYNGNGGTAGQTSAESGFAFSGWCDTPEGKVGTGHYKYADGERVTNPCGSTGATANDPVLLYAQWTPKRVTLPTPTRAGHDFSGWYTKPEGGQRVGGAGQSYAAEESISLFAHWRVHVTKLTFKSEDATVTTRTVSNGATYAEFGELPVPTSEDETKTFLGWYDKSEGESDATRITDATEVSWTKATATLYAWWGDTEYSIAYETDKGKINEGEVTTYKPGDTFQLPTDVTRGDDAFLGWYDTPRFTNKVERISTTDRGDKTFYAKWGEEAADRVTFVYADPAGATGLAYTNSYVANEQATLEGALFFREGYTQTKWREGDKEYDLKKSWGPADANHTFAAVWATNTYKIVYDGNGGVYSEGESKIERTGFYDSPVTTLPVSGWSRGNDTCVGWALTPTGNAVYEGGEKVVNLTAVNKGSVTLYAKWETNTDAKANVTKSSPKIAALLSATPSYSPASLTLSSSPILAAASSSPLTYTLHFSPGAAVVNPQAMTNWMVSGAVTLPDCLYTNVQGSTFVGWTYQGELVEDPFNPDIAFDGQIITVTAAWKPLDCGNLSHAVGLTNAVLTCEDKTKTWSVCKKAKEVHSGTTCLKVTNLDGESTSTLQMCANGSGLLTYQWKTDNKDCPASNVVDGVSYAVKVSNTNEWCGMSRAIDGAGTHVIVWYVPKHAGFPTFWLDDVRWEPKLATYTLTAVADPLGSGDVSVNGTSFDAGSTATLMAVANPGYTFVQWNDGSTNLTHDVTVWGDITNYVARFEKVATYRISVTAVPSEGGAVTGQGDYPIGTTTNLTATANDGWTFLRWSDGSTDTTHEIRVISDATYTALFTNICEVTASATPTAGGTVTGGGRYVIGETATLTATANDGYEFEYWSDGSTDVNHTITVLCATNLTATFSGSGPMPPGPGPTPVTTNCYSIAFDGNGATSGTMAEQTNVCGVATILASNAFVRTGYTFDGWVDKNKKSYADGATVTDLATTNRAALLKAVWRANKYDVRFDSGIGEAEAMPRLLDCAYGVAYKLPTNVYTRAGYTFAGWATHAAGEIAYADGEIVRNLSATGGVVSLYVVWNGKRKSQKFVDIAGNAAERHFTGELQSVAGYSVSISGSDYYPCDFSLVPGADARASGTAVGSYPMGISSSSFTNYNVECEVVFRVTDGWLKILPSKIGGEPGNRTVSAGGLSEFDATVEYGTAFDCSSVSNDFAAAYGACSVAYSALESGPWSAEAPMFTAVGTTSFWYRVTTANYESFVHEVAIVVQPRDMSSVTVDAIPDQQWTGSPITPKVVARTDGTVLVEGVDYYLTYANNTDPGEATAYVHGMGNYTATKDVKFNVVKKMPPHTLVTITGHAVTAAYDGKSHTASGYDFVSTNADYTAADFRCTANTSVSRTAVGTTSANLKAGDFENLNDEFVVEFVVAQDISVTVTKGAIPGEPGSGEVPPGGLSKFDMTATYDGTAHTLDLVALTNAFAGAGYNVAEIEYAAAQGGPWSKTPIAITDVGTVSFWYRVLCENCAPFAHQAKVTVTPRDIADATVAPIPDQVVTGEPIEPEVTVTDGTPSIITDDDYDVAYSDNVAVGTATVTLTGKRNYTGTRIETFEIVSLPGYYECGCGEAVSVNLQADFPDQTIKSVSGLPSGLKYNKSTGFVTGKATKAVTEKKATVTFTDRTKDYIYWTVRAGENHGVKIDFGEAATGEDSATVGVGTAVEWIVTAEESDAKITISKLPTGLKYNKTTGLVTGTPTKAKDFTMTVKTVVNGQTVTQTFYITVEPLPTLMVGTYWGVATVDGIAGQFQLKLAATGKATGYFYAAGKKISLKSAVLETAGEDSYSVTVSYTYNREKYTDEILLASAAAVEDIDLWTATLGTTSDVLDDLDATRDVIKEAKVKVPAGSYPVEDESLEEGDALTAKVTSKGSVKVSGKVVDGNGKLVSVSCATQLVFDEEGGLYCWITIYKAVRGQDPIERCFKWYLPEE